MENWIAQLWNQIGTPVLGETGLVAFCGALWKVSKIVETRLSLQAKANLARIIRMPSNSAEVVSEFSAVIKDAFDKLFKVRRIFGGSLVIPGFFRSAIASLSFVTIIILVIGIRLKGVDEFNFMILGFMGFIGLFFGLINILPDYLSLIETRYLLRFLSRRGGHKAWMILIIDALATSVIFVATIMGIFSVVVGSGGNLDLQIVVFYTTINTASCGLGLGMTGFNPLDQAENCREMWERGGFIFGAALISTFLTSVWIWLYVGAAMILKPLARALDKRNIILRHFNLKTYPISTIAMFANAVILTLGTLFVWT
jgi:hypothetical protein